MQPLQLAETSHVVGKVLQDDLHLRPRQADRAHQHASHVVGLRAEDVLDPDADAGFRPVALLAAFVERAVPLPLAVDPAPQAGSLQLLLYPGLKSRRSHDYSEVNPCRLRDATR